MAYGIAPIVVVPRALPSAAGRVRWAISRSVVLVVSWTTTHIVRFTHGHTGKYWHRHRRPRPVQYNSSADHHLGIIRAEEQAKSNSKRKRPQSTIADEPKTQPMDEDAEMETPGPSKPKFEPEPPSIPQERPSVVPDGIDRAVSPVSTASSASESPLAQRVKMNGGAHSRSAPPAPPESEAPARSVSSDAQTRVISPPQASPPRAAPSAPPRSKSTGRCAKPGAFQCRF